MFFLLGGGAACTWFSAVSILIVAALPADGDVAELTGPAVPAHYLALSSAVHPPVVLNIVGFG